MDQERRVVSQRPHRIGDAASQRALLLDLEWGEEVAIAPPHPAQEGGQVLVPEQGDRVLDVGNKPIATWPDLLAAADQAMYDQKSRRPKIRMSRR